MYIEVLVELSAFNIDKTFTYHVPKEKEKDIQVGIRVLVPFNNQVLEGFVLEILDEFNEEYDAKDILEIVDSEVILNEELISLGKYISDKTISTLISSYQVMLPKALKARHGDKINIKYLTYVKIKREGDILSDKQKDIMSSFENQDLVLYQDLKKINSSVDTLIKKGVLEKVSVENYRFINKSNFKDKVELTEEQKNVSQKVIDSLGKEKAFLLYGVTGSGKTEVYMEIIEEVLKRGKKALFLAPEITLTSQLLQRFNTRFSNIALLHSGLSDGERYDEYRKIKRGEVSLVIGTRSAIFAPLTDIGVIIIDECHSSSYIQDVMPRYDTIDISRERSKYHSCPILLGSATPTLDLMARSSKGLYELLVLKNRVGKRTLPSIQIVDMLKEKRVNKTSIGETLYKSISEKISKKEQIMLFINRRGYASILSCSNCGYTYKCPNCDITLTYHKTSDTLRCHYCGYATKKDNICPDCHEDGLKDLGTGTERIEEELKSLFDARIIRMDLDTTSKKGAHEKIINDFASGKYDILLGTQMISKGLDFPNVTLVGIINADNSLFVPSYKSNENTFELINQVSGRSGRGDKKGEVIIQTMNKDHFAIKLATENNYLAFYEEEMKNRLVSKYPPYFYLCYILIKSKDYSLLSSEVNKIGNILKRKLTNSIVNSPSMAIPFRINNVYQFGIIIKYKKEDMLYQTLHELIDHYKGNNKIKIEVEFNPHNI